LLLIKWWTKGKKFLKNVFNLSFWLNFLTFFSKLNFFISSFARNAFHLFSWKFFVIKTRNFFDLNYLKIYFSLEKIEHLFLLINYFSVERLFIVSDNCKEIVRFQNPNKIWLWLNIRMKLGQIISQQLGSDVTEYEKDLFSLVTK